MPGVMEHVVQGEYSSEHQAHTAQKQRDVKYPRRLPWSEWSADQSKNSSFPKNLPPFPQCSKPFWAACKINCECLQLFATIHSLHTSDLHSWILCRFALNSLFFLHLLSPLCRLSSTPQGQNCYLSGMEINGSSTGRHAWWNSVSLSLFLC